MKIIQLSTYPIVQPRHGGQIRVRHIREKLISLGCEVLTLSVCEPAYERYDEGNDLIIGLDIENRPFGVAHGPELQVARLSASDDRILAFLRAHIARFEPDLVFLEQAWLWPAIQTLFAEQVLREDRTGVVYSSQNVESSVKEAILRSHGVDEESMRNFVDEVRELELSLVRSAERVLCVTRADASYFEPFAKHEVLICPNGVARRPLDSEALCQAIGFARGRRYVVFAASAHPPNGVGFWEMMGPSLAKIPPDSMIVVVGSVGSILHSYAPPESEPFALVNSSVIQCVGQISDELLGALIWNSSGIIVPITSGGGSNLKTAEAIASGKPVVATSFACRGFEFARSLDSFFVCDAPHQFSKKVAEILAGDSRLPSDGPEEMRWRESIYWEHTLEPLEIVVASGVAPGSEIHPKSLLS